ncbi:hypothetical protein R1flu_020191 [Riccia fluitans]|uniref:Uncharacterized protein n=1 Tax=Riccia fluitans TaxID=41844 RepID=A0ABD1ZKV9_9MARC
MRGGITSVPLPAYWSSKDPDRWRRQSAKSSACKSSRCAANNANYAKITERPAKKPRLPYRSSSTSRSVSATSYPSTPAESERESKRESISSDCNTPLVLLAQPPSSSATLTPSTPLQDQPIAPGRYIARLNRSRCLPSCILPRNKEPLPYFQDRRYSQNPGFTAPPPSECDDYSGDEPEPEPPQVVRNSKEIGEVTMDPDRELPSPRDPTTTTGAMGLGILVSSLTFSETRTPSSPPPPPGNSRSDLKDFSHTSIGNSKTKTFPADEGTFSEDELAALSLFDTAISYQPTLDPTEFDENFHQFPLKTGGSESSATPALSEKGLDLFSDHDIHSIGDINRISSFYNALYTPDAANSADDHEVALNMQRSSAEHDLPLKSAVEIVLLSALITILMLACFPVLLSGVRYHILGCCSCTCESATSAIPPSSRSPLEQLKWLENWVHIGVQSLLGCQSPKQTLGSTVLR